MKREYLAPIVQAVVTVPTHTIMQDSPYNPFNNNSETDW